MSHWRVGEEAALEIMEAFVTGQGLARYEFERSCADKPGAVSTLSPCVQLRAFFTTGFVFLFFTA
jgi:hypothetical protein